jgi:Big-like domain-containing protein
VVGTGGAGLRPFGSIQPNSEVRNSETWGVLKLTLHPSSYEWQFVPVEGETFTDSGSENCHGDVGAPLPPETTAPTVSGVSPADGATDVAVDANMEATFSTEEAMDESTINGTNSTLSEQGSGTPVAAAVSYGPTTNKAMLDPTEDLKGGDDLHRYGQGWTQRRQGRRSAMTADTTWSFTTTLRSVAPAEVAADVIRDTIPNRTLPDTGGAQGVRKRAQHDRQDSQDGRHGDKDDGSGDDND